MSDPTTHVRPESRSLEVYHGRRLRKAAAVGTRAGGISLGNWMKNLFLKESACTHLALIEAPMENTVIEPTELLPLLSSFSKTYALEIFKDHKEHIGYQIAFHEEDNECIAVLRALFGSHLNVRTQNIETWNEASGFHDESPLAYLLPTSGLYPLAFALKWKEADIVNLVLERLKTDPSGALLLQLLVEPQPQSGEKTATEILAALNYLGRTVEAFRLNLIKERFSQPLALFALRLLGQDQRTLKSLARSLSVLNAPFNHFKEVPLKGRRARRTAQAVLERRVGLSDGLSWISLPELAGLWHLPLEPDFTIERARVREVATARIAETVAPGSRLRLPYLARSDESGRAALQRPQQSRQRLRPQSVG